MREQFLQLGLPSSHLIRRCLRKISSPTGHRGGFAGRKQPRASESVLAGLTARAHLGHALPGGLLHGSYIRGLGHGASGGYRKYMNVWAGDWKSETLGAKRRRIGTGGSGPSKPVAWSVALASWLTLLGECILRQSALSWFGTERAFSQYPGC